MSGSCKDVLRKTSLAGPAPGFGFAVHGLDSEESHIPGKSYISGIEIFRIMR